MVPVTNNTNWVHSNHNQPGVFVHLCQIIIAIEHFSMLLTGELHPKPKNMFYALSQNYQHFFGKMI